MQGGAVSRRIQIVLNRMGLVCSYDKSLAVMAAFGNAQRQEMRDKVAKGTPFMMCWDNIVRTEKKEEETLRNRRTMHSMTSGYVQFLNIPPPPASASDPESPNHWMMAAYANISNAIERNNGIGLPKELMEVPFPDYTSVTEFDMLFIDSIQHYQPLIARAHSVDILQRFCGSNLQTFKDSKGRPLTPAKHPQGAEYHKMEPTVSQITVLPIVDVDETTLDGTSRIFDLYLEELGTTLAATRDKHIDVVGDQLSNARVRSLQEYRTRDYLDHRLHFASVKMGYFHLGLAFMDAIFRCQMGRTDGRDPGSLARFITVLGRSGVSEKIPDFNACKRFILQMFDGYILAAYITLADEQCIAMKQGRVRTASDLKQAVEKLNWKQLTEELVRRFFAMTKTRHLREKAITIVTKSYQERRQEIMDKPKQDRTAEEILFCTAKFRDKFIKEESLKHRDIVYENALLFIQQALVFKDFDRALRHGESGRLERLLEMALIMCAGCGKSNYYAELMEQQIDRSVCWTPEHAYIDLNNCLVNIAGKDGKFLARDEFNEHINDIVASVANPRDTWQSLNFHRQVLPRSMMLLKTVRDVIPIEAGAAVLGTRHSRVQDAQDIERIAHLLVQDKIFINTPGRFRSGSGEIKMPINESVDAFLLGSEEIIQGKMFQKIMKKRMRVPFPEAPSSSDEDSDENID
jgi:hypothetical protein